MRLSIIATTALLFAASPLQADEQAVTDLLKPYKATYISQWDMGISFSANAVRELKRTGDQWNLSLNAKAMIASLNEFSEFTVQDNQIRPDRYEYHRTVLGSKKDAVLQFNWNTGTVLNDIKKKPWTMDTPVGTLDNLSYQMQLRLDIASGKEELVYQVADGGKLKTYPFKRIGHDVIKTSLGSFNTVKIQRDRGPNSKRETFIWFAPELDYMVVKLQQVEKSGKEYSMLLDKLEYQQP